jgi:hypothetical protein
MAEAEGNRTLQTQILDLTGFEDPLLPAECPENKGSERGEGLSGEVPQGLVLGRCGTRMARRRPPPSCSRPACRFVDPLAALQFDVAGGAAPTDLGLRPSSRVEQGRPPARSA